ncbi:MAG: hypothetical protein GY853_14425 [PVC group bacterium]|nr:hypothetical protein [PVC group bacterium]
MIKENDWDALIGRTIVEIAYIPHENPHKKAVAQIAIGLDNGEKLMIHHSPEDFSGCNQYPETTKLYGIDDYGSELDDDVIIIDKDNPYKKELRDER